MAAVSWAPAALRDVAGIRWYIAQDDPVAADGVLNRLFAAADSLSTFPKRGRRSAKSTRLLATVWPYVMRYAITGDEVEILSVRHGRRRPTRR